MASSGVLTIPARGGVVRSVGTCRLAAPYALEVPRVDDPLAGPAVDRSALLSSAPEEPIRASILPLDLCRKLGDALYRSYEDRLRLQPGHTEATLDAFNRSAGTPRHKLMSALIGMRLAEALCDLGPHTLDMMRAYGRQIRGGVKSLADTGPNIPLHLISGVTDARGDRHFLDPSVVIKLAHMRHQAWAETVKMPIFEGHTPLSCISFPARVGAIRLGKDQQLPPLDLLNADAISSLCLCARLAELSEDDFTRIQACAYRQTPLEANPFKLQLSFRTIDRRNPDHPPRVLSLAPLLIESPQSAAAPEAAAVLWLRRNRLPEIAQRLRELHAAFEAHLLQEDERAVIPTVLKISDAIVGGDPMPPAFEKTLAHIHRLYRLRSAWTTQLLTAGRACPGRALADAPVSTAAQFDQFIAAHIPAKAARLIEGRAEQYLRYRRNLAEHLSRTACAPAPDAGTRLLSGPAAHAHFAEIRRLIDGVRANAPDEYFRRHGGILCDFYDERFWSTFVAGNGRLIVEERQGKTTGFLFFYQPARIPESHAAVPAEYRQNAAASFAELAVAEGTPDTCPRLFRSMLCQLNLTSAQDSFGVCHIENARSLCAMKRLGYAVLFTESTIWNPPNGRAFVLVPIFLPVSPARRALLKELGFSLGEYALPAPDDDLSLS